MKKQGVNTKKQIGGLYSRYGAGSLCWTWKEKSPARTLCGKIFEKEKKEVSYGRQVEMKH